MVYRYEQSTNMNSAPVRTVYKYELCTMQYERFTGINGIPVYKRYTGV